MKTKARPRRRAPGEVRDAIRMVLDSSSADLGVQEIAAAVKSLIGATSPSSIRSYLSLNEGSLFVRTTRGKYASASQVREPEAEYAIRKPTSWKKRQIGRATIYEADCFEWLRHREPNSIQAVVTDPPYGLHEYLPEQQAKLRSGKGGVWRVPPSFDGSKRSPLPRFTVLGQSELRAVESFFFEWSRLLLPCLVPGANVIVATNPLLSYLVSSGMSRAGLERRGEVARLVMTMRGGDRPKLAHEEYPGVSVMPRSMWEPWVVFRKPLQGRVQENLRKWKTGGFRRPSADRPFGDVIQSAPTHPSERSLAPHPSLKPQLFLRTLVRGVLPLGEGVVLDTFCGAGSTLAAAEALGYESVGLEIDPVYFKMAIQSIPRLVQFKNGLNYSFSLRRPQSRNRTGRSGLESPRGPRRAAPTSITPDGSEGTPGTADRD